MLVESASFCLFYLFFFFLLFRLLTNKKNEFFCVFCVFFFFFSRYLDIGAHQMTTDDLLDQLIYAIIKARQKNIRLATARMKREEKEGGGGRGGGSGGVSSFASSFSRSSTSSSRTRSRRNPAGSLSNHAMASSTNRGELLDRMRLLSLKRSFLATNIQYVD